MRILHIDKCISSDDSSSGGVGGCIELLTELLCKRGHEVLHFGCDGKVGPVFEDFTAAKSPSALLRMIHNSQAATRLRSFLRHNPVDIVHLHNIYRHLTPSILPVVRNSGIVMTVHDYRQAGMERFFWSPSVGNEHYSAAANLRCAGVGGLALAIESLVQRVSRRYYSNIDFFLCPTHHMLHSLRTNGAPAGKLACLPNPVRVPPVSKPTGRVVFAGRLSVEKSPDLMLDLAEALPEARVTIAGDGPEMEYLSSRAGTNVELTGHLSRSAMDDLYESASTVVLTSCCMENSPAAMLEAMAAGICVVVPDQPALREWVEDGHTGRIYATGDARDLVRVVTEVLAGQSTAAGIGRQARDRILYRHDPEKIADGLEYFYDRAAHKSKKRRIVL